MKRYRVNIFAKVGHGAEVYQANTIESEDEESAKAVAETEYRKYESWAIQTGSKHAAMFYELLEGDRLVYSSSTSKSVLTASKSVLTAMRNLIFFRRAP